MAENVVQLVQESGTRKRVKTIEIARFLQRTYSHRKHEKNQGVFVVKCFLSAGSKHFQLPDKYNQKSTELESARMLMKVDTNHRRLTDQMKKSFRIRLIRDWRSTCRRMLMMSSLEGHSRSWG